jgi:hypothetical protein
MRMLATLSIYLSVCLSVCLSLASKHHCVVIRLYDDYLLYSARRIGSDKIKQSFDLMVVALHTLSHTHHTSYALHRVSFRSTHMSSHKALSSDLDGAYWAVSGSRRRSTPKPTTSPGTAEAKPAPKTSPSKRKASPDRAKDQEHVAKIAKHHHHDDDTATPATSNNNKSQQESNGAAATTTTTDTTPHVIAATTAAVEPSSTTVASTTTDHTEHLTAIRRILAASNRHVNHTLEWLQQRTAESGLHLSASDLVALLQQLEAAEMLMFRNNQIFLI